MMTATPGRATPFDVGAEAPLTVRLPKQGEGVAGVLIADPCVGGGILSMGCFYAGRFKTRTRIPELLNAFVPSGETDFWGILGDNFYDRTGSISKEIFAELSLETKAKIFVAVPGNHDFWILGGPKTGSPLDQCANGFMQYYVQDAKAAEGAGPGNAVP